MSDKMHVSLCGTPVTNLTLLPRIMSKNLNQIRN